MCFGENSFEYSIFGVFCLFRGFIGVDDVVMLFVCDSILVIIGCWV